MKWPKRAISRYLTLVCGRQLLLVVGTQSWNLIFLPFLVKNIVAKSISGQILLKLPKYFLRCTMLLNHPKKFNQITWAAEDKKIIVTKYHQQNRIMFLPSNWIISNDNLLFITCPAPNDAKNCRGTKKKIVDFLDLFNFAISQNTFAILYSIFRALWGGAICMKEVQITSVKELHRIMLLA